jgi:hypothetical protein
MESRYIVLLSITVLGMISNAKICYAEGPSSAECALALNRYLKADMEPDEPLLPRATCDEVNYEFQMKEATGCPVEIQQKFQKAHALCVSIKADQKDYDDCNQTSDKKRAMTGCIHVTNDQTQSLVDRVFANMQMANMYLSNDRRYCDEAGYGYVHQALKLDPRNVPAYAASAVGHWRCADGFRSAGFEDSVVESEKKRRLLTTGPDMLSMLRRWAN